MIDKDFSAVTEPSQAQANYNFLRQVHTQYWHTPEAMRSLVLHFVDTKLDGIRSKNDLLAVEAFLTHPEKAVLIEKPSPLRALLKFDADKSFNSQTDRGGNPEIAKILAGLDPEGPDVLLDRPLTGAPQMEPEVQRRNEQAERVAKEKDKAFKSALQLFHRETTNALLTDRPQDRSPGQDAGYRWISENIVGGKEICDKANRVTDTIKLIGHHGGHSIEDAIRLTKGKDEYETRRAQEYALKHS